MIITDAANTFSMANLVLKDPWQASHVWQVISFQIPVTGKILFGS